MIDWLNTNEGAVVGLATVALVVVTVVYVVFTYRIVQLTRAASTGAQHPVTAIVNDGKIGIAPLGERHQVSVWITNSGPGPAFKFKPRLNLGPWWRRSVVELEYLGDGPDELSGTAVALEPTAMPKGRHDLVAGPPYGGLEPRGQLWLLRP